MNGTRPSPTTGFPVLAAFVLIGGLDTAADERFPGGPNTITRDAEGANVVHAADLDGDGDADVLSASWGDDKIAWYENLGDGSFSEPRVLTTDADYARSVNAADLDGDGDLDVVSASDHDNKLAWYENLGAGEFAEQRTISTTMPKPITLEAADLDGDGDVDLVAASIRDEIAWYENLGDVRFAPKRTITTDVDEAWTVHAADLDGDGDQDLVSASTEDNKVAWYRNDGAGGFGDQIVITEAADGAIRVDTADLDGDGDLDVLSASLRGNRIAWYENDGAGAFSELRTISSRARGATAVHAADLDGDGDADVISASSGSNKVAWYENLCNGEFSEQRVITTSVDAPWSVYTADVDGDGDLDVLSASENDGQVAWYENVTPDGLSFAKCTLSAQDGVVYSTNAHAADLDNDGDIDVISSSPLHWHENTDAGFRQGEPIVESAGSPTWVHSADLDGDHDADPVAGFYGGKMAWYERTEGGFWAENTIAEKHLYRLRSVSDGDLDGDGDLDLAAAWGVAGVSWHENLGDRFENRSLPGAGFGQSVHVADLDGDNDQDVLASSGNDRDISWWSNSGNGEFSEKRVIATGAQNARSATTADLDGDGDLDVLYAARDDKLAWHENLGDGEFSDPRVISSEVGGASSAAAADFDGDGDLDVLYAAYGRDNNSHAGTFGWFENLGRGTFRLAFKVSARGATHALPADVDADGDADIVVSLSYPARKVILYRNLTRTGTPPTAAPKAVAATAEPNLLLVTWRAIPFSAVGGTYLTGYVATAHPIDGGTASTCESEPPSLECAIDGLRPDTAYTVTVHAENSRGAGPSSAGIHVRTLALADHYRFVAEGLNDGAGFSLARIGDRDGDGNPDVAIGAPFHSFGGLAHRGAVYLVASGDLRAADRSDGREDGGIFLHNVADLPNSWKLLGAHADGNAGWSVSRIDDLDGDGSFDIAVGAPNGTMGAAYLLATADLEQADAEDGATDGVVDLGNAATGQHSWIITGVPGDGVGSVIVAGGDTDGDGTDELLLLARNERTGTSDIGALYVVDTDDLAAADRADGDADRVVRTRHLPAGPGSWRFAGGNLSGPVGGVAAYAGDSDADGRDDVLIGSPRASPGGRVAGGAAYLAAAADFETADAGDLLPNNSPIMSSVLICTTE